MLFLRSLVLACSTLVLFGCGDGGGSSQPDASRIDAGGGGDSDAGMVDAGVPERVVCDVELATVTTGACGVHGGSGPGMLLRGTVLADSVYENGSVLIDAAGVIACVGCDCSADPAFDSAYRVDCPGATISPGLINPHDHIGFTEGAPINHGATRYEHRHDWRGSLPAPSNPHGNDGAAWGEVRMVMSGVTSMAGSGFAAGMVRNLDISGAAQHGLDREPAELETFPLGDSNEQFRADCTWNYKLSENEVSLLNAYVPHISEGIESYAAEEFLCQSRPVGPGEDYIENNTAVVHGIGLTAIDLDRMARHRTALVWSPRSNIDLYGMTATVTAFDELGGVIALGTDWTYSGSINSVRELACADYLNRTHFDGHFTDRELWRMATLNAAAALGFEDVLGSIEVGKIGDLAVYSTDASDFRAVIEAGAADVALVLRGGTLLFGESDVATAIGQSCDSVDVCGEARVLCATREIGKSYAQLATDVAGAYPAFFCSVPDGEPSCVPSRPGEYDGVTATDGDGDGVLDVDDNCPGVFNPPRPIDVLPGGSEPVQADADGDGVGDACDPTPVPADIDGDGVANDADNCPYDANAGQDDSDEDGKGDVCDPCVDVANPDGFCPAAVVTITDIQTGAVAVGSSVRVVGAVVTGVGSNGFAMQDPAAAVPANSGILVYVPGAMPSLTIGSVVDVDGATQEYFGDTEITATMVTVTGSTTPIAATDVSLADAASEAYEGVLVRVTSASVTDAAFNCSAANPACTDANLFELGGAAGVLVYNRYFVGTWPTPVFNDTVTVTGVMMYRFDRRRILPRSPADVTID